MPIQLIGPNLNYFGNTGQFETDRSTWGFSDNFDFEFTRSSLIKTAGNYSCQCRALIPTAPPPFLDNYRAVRGNIPYSTSSGASVEKTYCARARVRVPSSAPIAADEVIISLLDRNQPQPPRQTNLGTIDTTVADAKDQWQTIEYLFRPNVEGAITLYVNVIAPEGLITDGLLYVDQFEIHEYIEEAPPEAPVPDLVFHSNNPVTLPILAPTGWNTLLNFRMYNEVRVEDEADSEVYNTKLQVDLPPTEDGEVVFYLAEAFRDVFTFDVPSPNQTEIVRLTDRIKRFKNYYGILQDTDIEPSVLEEGPMNLILWGGISKEKWPGFNYFTDYLPVHKKFLSWAPIIKEVDRNQEDYLNFWIYSDQITTIKLELTAHFDDGTSQASVIKTQSGTLYGELYQIPAGPTNTGALLAEKKVLRYDLRLLDQADAPISETRTYYIIHTRHPNTRHFMFLNSLGSWEVLRFTGKASTKTNYSREVVQRFLPHDYSALDGEFAINASTMERVTTYSSGFIKSKLAKQWHEYLQDFLLAKPAPIFHLTGGSRIPVTILDSSYQEADQDYKLFIRFEAKPSYINESFTPENL